MQNKPFYFSDTFMSVYRFLLIFAFMLGFASIFAGIGYGLYTFVATDFSFATSMYLGLVLFLKGAAITAILSFIGFFAFWKRHQVAYENCQKSGAQNCHELGFFRLA